jgi:aerobic carbon-monoxide dehydrogenase large subunit
MGSILGTRVQRLEDPRLLTVGGTYVEDIDLPGATWLTYVQAPHAHARIVGIDTSAAGASPGVLAVFTADDLAGLGLVPHVNPAFPDEMSRPFVAVETVRYVGQPVVAIIAEDRAQGADAADLVLVDCSPRWRHRRSPTSSGPRASGNRVRSERFPPCTTRSSTPSATSASATSKPR